MGLLIQYTLVFATILAIVALGGMFSERSGIINLGLEGIMVIGALCGAVMLAILTDANAPAFIRILLSIIASMIGGAIYSLLLGFACIKLKADQTITGTALNIMSTALAVILARIYTKTVSSEIKYDSSLFSFGGNFTITIFTILLVIIAVITFLFMYKTKYGLRLMACGENPQAAAAQGINVYKQRYIGVIISGVLAGLGGLANIASVNGYWDFKNGVAGIGFLALAVMIFGQWKPLHILGASIIFGLSQTIGILYSGKFGIPSFVYKILPYVICMFVLALTSKNSKAPKAEGIPYDVNDR